MTPDDLAPPLERATALLAAGRLDEAAEVCASGGDDPHLLRVAAYIFQQQRRLGQAAAAYEQVLRAFPRDWESMNNYGNVLFALERFDEAVAAFQEAIRLRPDRVEIVFNLSEALSRGERHAERQSVMRTAAAIDADDPAIQTELGLAEAAVYEFEAAESAFREAIRLDTKGVAAYLELGVLLENQNRTDDLTMLAEQADAAGLGDEAKFLRAWALRRQGQFEEALAFAEATPATINPVRRAHLLAGLYDRLGDIPRAFAAFEEMNRASEAAAPAPPGPSYRDGIAASAAQTTPEWVAGWTQFTVAPTPPAPIFIAGFPRSGTTLLDTLLMNLPDLHVLEEQPVMRTVEAAIAPGADLGRMSSDEARQIRDYYFATLGQISPPPPGRTVVDKHPLHMARMPLIHRIFPDAKIILVERHPCDAVLSCFMANFNLNHAMRSFTDLDEAARTYDTVFDAWTRAETLLPLQVHRVRYERMVEDLEGEMRALLAFLGIEWDPKVLDNQASAAARGLVRTASYSQVAEPIYQRAAGRWERYRDQLAPVLPILAPWVERLGYLPLAGTLNAAEALEQKLAGNPSWTEGHVRLARLRWAGGEREGFARSFEQALTVAPRDVVLWSRYLASLMFAGRHAQILETVERGRAAAGAHPLFDLSEAVAFDDLDDLAASEPRFAAMAESEDPSVAFYRVRHLLRAGRYDEAATFAEHWQRTASGDHFVPYLANAWRLTGDPRWQWLEGDERLVGAYDLAEVIGPLEPLAEALRALHVAAGQPLDQSVRGGTQVDEILSRQEPEFARLGPALAEAVARHIAQLPPLDPDHPTLRYRRDAPVGFTGSWSVRLAGAGHHVGHVHPNGWLSSAFYVAVPSEVEAGPAPAGWLTLGQPPADLKLDLAPIRTIEPKPGRLALFPSTMWHGTVPFAAGERLTIAFDVAHPEG